MKKVFLMLFVFLLSTKQFAQAFEFKNPFSFKNRQESEPMVQTWEEWREKAKNVNLEDRKTFPYQQPQDKDFKPKFPPSKKFVKYNVSAGGNEINISQIKNKLEMRSQGVISPDFKYMAYGEYYFSPSFNQISSEIYLQKLNSGVTRMQRALNTTTQNTRHIPIISSGTKEFRENLFSTLTIVDFSKKSDMLLVKEKIGSGVRGIYQSYVWVYYMQGEQTNWSAKKFDILNETIKNYHAKNSHIALNNYRWDIRPLGFSKEKPNIVITEAFAWDKDKKEIFLGLWGLDTKNASANLISKKQTPIEVSANGIIVKEFLP